MPQRLLQNTRAESFDLRALNALMMRVRENPERDKAIGDEIVRRASALREYLELVGYGVRPAAEQTDGKKRPSSPPAKTNGKANGARSTGKNRAVR